MNATMFNLDGCELTYGSYTPLTRSLYRAAIDAMQMFKGDEFMVSRHFSVVKVGNGRIVIGKKMPNQND